MNLDEIKVPNKTPEQLSESFERLRREFQSSKDKSVKQTNERLDAMQAQLDRLEELLENALRVIYEQTN